MSQRLYTFFMSLLEKIKPVDIKNRYKIIRGCKLLLYILVSKLANVIIKTSIPTIKDAPTRDKYVIASLTTFPKRIRSVRYAIMSILMQTYRPDKIILWLATSQFPDKQVPDNLKDLLKFGLEVRFCEDLKSHKKYFYALQEQKPDELVITFDDDIIYHPHTIERLVTKSNQEPGKIVCSQAHIISFNNGKILPYSKWETGRSHKDYSSDYLMPLTGSGCLYPYGVMPPETFDKTSIIECAASADDLWIGSMAILGKRKIVLPEIVPNLFSVVTSSQQYNLGVINCLEEGNDIVMKRILNKYIDIPLYSR